MANNTSHFYIYHFDNNKHKYRKIVRFDIKDDQDDMYFVDESINDDTSHLSFHTSGKVHIKYFDDDGRKRYEDLFNNSALFKDDRCHQFMYYKLGNIDYYPLVPSNKILKPNLILKGDEKLNGKMMIKFLVGKLPLKSNLIHKQHVIDDEVHFNPYIFNNKMIICVPLIIEGEDEKGDDMEEYNKGIHIVLFNSGKEILDDDLFKKKIDIGKIKDKEKGNIQIDWKEEDVNGEKFISIFYRLHSRTFRYTFKYKVKLFLDWVIHLFK